MKKLLCLVFAISLSIIALSGCNTNGKTEEFSSASQNGEATTAFSNDTTQNEQGSYRVEPINFEISAKCDFLPNSPLGIFNYNDKYGLIDSDGKVVIEPIYEKLSAPSEGHLIAEKSDGTFSVLTTEGKEIGAIDYNKGELEINRIMTLDDETCNNGTGQFSDGLAFMTVKGNSTSDIKSICIDTEGNIVFESKFDLQGKFINGVAVGLDIDPSKTFEFDIVAVDKSGKELWRKTSSGLPMNTAVTDIKIKDNIIIYQSPETKLWGAVDINGKDVLDCTYEELTYAGNGKIGFNKYGLWGYVDYKGKEVIEPQFTKAYDFRGGIALVSDNGGQYSIIDESGNILLNCDSVVSYYENGIIMENGSRILDTKGNVLYETDISQNGMGGTANGLSYEGGEIISEFLRAENATNNEKTYNYFKILN